MSGLVVLITGGRSFEDESTVFSALDAIHAETPIERLIHGGCHKRGETSFCGADGCADRWARARGVTVLPYTVTDEEWERVGKGAGPARNTKMILVLKHWRDVLKRKVVVVAFRGGAGTADCVGKARAAGVEVREVLSTR